MLESQIQKKILDYLATLDNCWAVKTIQTNKLGCPDILACVEGRFYAFEVKQEKGKTTPIQDHQLRRINMTGGVAHVVRSVEEVVRIVNTM